jgi:hypothetical protein
MGGSIQRHFMGRPGNGVYRESGVAFPHLTMAKPLYGNYPASSRRPVLA